MAKNVILLYYTKLIFIMLIECIVTNTESSLNSEDKINMIINDLELWKEKVIKANTAFSSLQYELENSIVYVTDKINNLEVKIKELSKALESMNQVSDINQALFSPYENSHKIAEEQNYNTEIVLLKNQLTELINELKILSDKRKQYNSIKECLDYFNLIIESKDTSSKKEKNGDSSEGLSLEQDGIKILETQELERHRIARDLHDSTIQNLTNLVHKTELCLRLVDLDTIRAKLEMATMIENIRFIINNTREIIYNLRPMSIQDLGLKQEIENFLKHFMQQNEIQIKFDATEENPNILPVINHTIFRIIQEACNNISKYSKATICKITLDYLSDHIELTIQDNGVGFEANDNQHKRECENSGFGLSIMRERVQLLSGNLKIESSKSKGTKIQVIIPYHEQKGE